MEADSEMARGKIQIKKIVNLTERQVTYSKRRNGLFEKAHELAVLCDAEVPLVMVSCTDKVYDYSSSPTTTMQIFDRYQKIPGIDLWSSHYEVFISVPIYIIYSYQKMQENLEKLKEVDRKIRRETRQKMDQGLDDLRNL